MGRYKYIKLIYENINMFLDLVSMAINSNLGYAVEKSVSQCYDLLAILSSLWKDILPSTVYCKFIGKYDMIVIMLCKVSLK